jgi:hypothetical protein
LVTVVVESINLNAMWDSVIDTVEEGGGEEEDDEPEPIRRKVSKKVEDDLAALRVSRA